MNPLHHLRRPARLLAGALLVATLAACGNDTQQAADMPAPHTLSLIHI